MACFVSANFYAYDPKTSSLRSLRSLPVSRFSSTRFTESWPVAVHGHGSEICRLETVVAQAGSRHGLSRPLPCCEEAEVAKKNRKKFVELLQKSREAENVIHRHGVSFFGLSCHFLRVAKGIPCSGDQGTTQFVHILFWTPLLQMGSEGLVGGRRQPLLPYCRFARNHGYCLNLNFLPGMFMGLPFPDHVSWQSIRSALGLASGTEQNHEGWASPLFETCSINIKQPLLQICAQNRMGS